MIIAIDGLSTNGKSTLAKMISKKLNFKNFNTGAIYRCIALEIINKNLDISNMENTLNKLKKIDINFDSDKVLLNGKDVRDEIRTEEVSIKANNWATLKEIKQLVKKIQLDFLEKYDTVIEGRDIATRIAPNAEIKFYLYSDFETRVERAWKKNEKIDIEEIRHNLEVIDYIDINGGNFVKPENAIEIDTTNKSIEEVFDIMMESLQNLNIKKG